MGKRDREIYYDFVNPPHHGKLWQLWKSLWLFVRIVYRIDQSDTRMSPALAWKVSGIIHDGCCCGKCKEPKP